jgi:nucleoside-diphosphate-sugar epimerase
VTGHGVAGSVRVCVTGGQGFIGTHLCLELAERGYEVVNVDRVAGPIDGQGAPHAVHRGRPTAVRADVSTASLAPLLDGADAVIHLAALPGVRAAHSRADLWRHNAAATARVAAALPPGCRLVLASTSSVYGNAGRLPTPEAWPPAPLNPYAVTKLEAERAALRAAARGADVVVCRLFTVFGPGQRSDMAFSRWIRSILDDRPVPWCALPGARREFTYVGDAVRGLAAALERGRSGEIYNLPGTGPSYVRSALAEVEGLLGRRARLAERPSLSEAVATAACGAKARAELGHEPRVGLREGIERQLEAAAPLPAARPAAA